MENIKHLERGSQSPTWKGGTRAKCSKCRCKLFEIRDHDDRIEVICHECSLVIFGMAKKKQVDNVVPNAVADSVAQVMSQANGNNQ